MPLFEYQCKTCGHRFEALVIGSRQPQCPRCESSELEKQFSTFGCGAVERRGWRRTRRAGVLARRRLRDLSGAVPEPP